MTDHLVAKTDQYETLLEAALEEATPLDGTGEECLEMASAYLDDGRHFRSQDDDVTALAAFSYGHGWLDAGARCGVLSVPEAGDLFAI